MLEFERQIFDDTVRSDGLVVAAKGLNLYRVIVNILEVYRDPGNLVLVLNASDAEQKYFVQQLQGEHVYIEHDTGQIRIEQYLCGGIHFLAARILVVDLLKKRIPIEKISGIVVLRAHRIFESCNEAFVLKLYRQHNKTGFVKAFSNSAQSFTTGFGHVERVMRALFVKQLHIWPRFHTLVRNTLKRHEPQVVELHVPVTDRTKTLQTYILEIMNVTVKELKRLNPALELQEITVENCLTEKFHKILQAQLNAIWHRLSNKSAQLIAELKTLRHLLMSLFYSDSVTFYATVLEYRKAEYARSVDWVLTSAAALLFRDASSLVFTGDREFNPEPCPKWAVLDEILKKEIPTEMARSPHRVNVTVLILCADQRTCHQLNEVLSTGPRLYLFLLALKRKVTFKSISKEFEGLKPDLETTQKGQEEEEEEDFHSTYVLAMNQSLLDNSDRDVFSPFTQMETMDLTQLCHQPKVIIQTFKGLEDYVSLQHSLEVTKPDFVVMYHSNVTAVREIEMYEGHRNGDHPLKVYFLMHAGTVEEQAYLTDLRREKEAFEYLIETKANMVVPEDQDGKSDQCTTLERGGDEPKNTRRGGQSQERARRVVVVDMREFRSDLPSLIHKRGIEIEPVTITVGDYILTPEICVERKSLSDLISSLNSGRLYQQCVQMQRFYAQPMLLIEFDQTRAFGWNMTETGNSVQDKLLLLTIHFPKLKIIWSPSPYATAQLFEELKQGKKEPSVEEAASIGDVDLDAIETKYNANVYDFVRKLPGITSKNIDTYLRRGVNLQSVIRMSQEELSAILGHSADAAALYDALHGECHAEAPKQGAAKPARGRGGYKRGKSRP